MKKLSALFLSLAFLLILSVPVFAEAGPSGTVVFWGLNPEAIGSGNAEMIASFEELYPDLKIEAQTTPGTTSYASQDVTKLLAAIAAGTPPDVTNLDRFTAGQYAARNTLMPLAEYSEKYGLDINEYEEYTVREGSFEGEIYCIPTDTDTRPYFWNKEVYRDAGLDPEAPPTTWDVWLEHIDAMNIIEDDGTIIRLGFIPFWGTARLMMFTYSNGANYLNEDGRTAQLNTPEVIEAAEFVTKIYDMSGGAENVNAYQGAFLGEADNPFILGQVGSCITVNNAAQQWAQYAPELEYGTGLPPAPEGKPQITWSGGWSYAIPMGARNPEGGFVAIKYLTQDGVLIQQAAKKAANAEIDPDAAFLPFLSAHMPTMQELITLYVDPLDDSPLKQSFIVSEQIKSVSKIRPSSAVTEVMWTEQNKAAEAIIYHEEEAKDAMDAANAVFQAELDKFWADYDAGVFEKD